VNRFLKLNLPIKIGVLLLVIGTSPLLIVILTDTLGIIDAPNPVGFGIIFFITFWPAIILIIIGIIKKVLKK
jgi:hypothetical protein